MVTISAKKEMKISWFHSLKFKIVVSYIFVSFVPMLFFFNTMLVSMEDYYSADRQKKMLTTANIFAGTISRGNFLLDESKQEFFHLEVGLKSKEGPYRILVLDQRGVVVADSYKIEVGTMLLVPEVIEAFQKNNAVKIHGKEKTVYAASTILNEASEKIGAVLLIQPIDDIYVAISEIERKLILFSVLITCILGVLLFFMSQLLIDPLNNILKIVQKMSEGHLHQRITVKGRDEFSALGQAFNNMTEKLEQVEKTREEFVSNVSHELKTPLSSMKVLSESILFQEDVPTATYREFLQDINSEIDRMTTIVIDLLNLVKLDQVENSLNIRQTDLNKMVEDILKRLSPLAAQKNIDLIFDEVRKVSIEADQVKLSLAFSNLIENGIKYTQDEGTVKVTIDADHQNAFITVSDTGIGINEDEQSKIFNRFYRVDKTRDRETGGTGLGLSITQKTVLLHNGSIRVSSKENSGTTFIVRLPIHRPLPRS